MRGAHWPNSRTGSLTPRLRAQYKVAVPQPPWSTGTVSAHSFLRSFSLKLHPFRYPAPEHRYVAKLSHPRYGTMQ